MALDAAGTKAVLIEVQRAELMMNLNKPKKEMLIGLECQCVKRCVPFLLLECQRCCLGLSALVGKIIIDLALFSSQWGKRSGHCILSACISM